MSEEEKIIEIREDVKKEKPSFSQKQVDKLADTISKIKEKVNVKKMIVQKRVILKILLMAFTMMKKKKV